MQNIEEGLVAAASCNTDIGASSSDWTTELMGQDDIDDGEVRRASNQNFREHGKDQSSFSLSR